MGLTPLELRTLFCRSGYIELNGQSILTTSTMSGTDSSGSQSNEIELGPLAFEMSQNLAVPETAHIELRVGFS